MTPRRPLLPQLRARGVIAVLGPTNTGKTHLAFVAIDEVQLAADLDRGHVFTDRLLNQRGREETLLIGSMTMRPLIEALIPGVHVVTRPRLSNLSFAGEKKVSRLPRRSAIVAFSAEEVYGIAE